MKSYTQFINESAAAAQKAWTDYMNSNANLFAKGGKFDSKANPDAYRKASNEFMKTYMKTGKAPGWATPGTSVKPPAGPSVKPPASGATQAANQAAKGSGFFRNARSVVGTAWRSSRPVRGILGRALNVLNYPVIGDMIDPRGTSAYDQVTGPNAYYNAPGYKGPRPQPGQTLADIHRQAADPKPAPKPAAKVEPKPSLTQQLGGLSIGPGGFNINGKPVKTTQTSPKPIPQKPIPPRPQKSARQLELDSINADKSLSPMQKWAKANPKLAIAQKEKERIRGTVQSDNPLLDRMKLRSGMRLGSSIVQDPKVQELGKGYQRLANNPNTLRQKLGLKTK